MRLVRHLFLLESSEKIRRALRKNIKPPGEKFRNGDRVYFLRDNKWKGPGWVIGQDNVVVFVRYGGTYVRVHESRIMRDIDNPANKSKITSGESQTQSSDSQKKNVADDQVISGQDDSEDDDHDSPVNNENQADESDRESHSSDDNNTAEDAHGEHESNTYNAQDPEEDDPSDQNIQHFEHSSSVGKLKKNQTISFKVNGQADGREAIILGRAGKASTNKKNWFNIEYRKLDSLRGEQMSIDLKSVYTRFEYCKSS